MRNRLPSLRAPLAALQQSKPEQGDIPGSPPGAPRAAAIIVSLASREVAFATEMPLCHSANQVNSRPAPMLHLS